MTDNQISRVLQSELTGNIEWVFLSSRKTVLYAWGTRTWFSLVLAPGWVRRGCSRSTQPGTVSSRGFTYIARNSMLILNNIPWLLFLGVSESAINDSLILADSLETYPYSNSISLMICLISSVYLAVLRELKWNPSGLKSSRETLCFNKYQWGRFLTSLTSLTRIMNHEIYSTRISQFETFSFNCIYERGLLVNKSGIEFRRCPDQVTKTLRGRLQCLIRSTTDLAVSILKGLTMA